jgi:hypothetical protein
MISFVRIPFTRGESNPRKAREDIPKKEGISKTG